MSKILISLILIIGDREFSGHEIIGICGLQAWTWTVKYSPDDAIAVLKFNQLDYGDHINF